MYKAIFVAIIIFIVAWGTIKMTPPPHGKGEILDFQFTKCLRGVAILLVMLSHIAGSYGTNIFTPLGGTGVAIFLCLSGYGLNESYKKNGLKKYWIKKIERVFIPYFILQTVSLFFVENIDIRLYLFDILGIKTQYWYIGFLLKQYIVFYIFTRFCYKYRCLLMLIFSLIVLFLFPNIQAEQAFSFVIGVYISRYVERISNLSMRNFSTISVLALIIGGVFLAVKQLPAIRMHETDFIYSLIQCGIKFPLGLFFIAGLSAFPILLSSRFVMFTGLISYELYLIHMKFLFTIHDSLIYTGVFFAGVYGLSYLFYVLNNRILHPFLEKIV